MDMVDFWVNVIKADQKCKKEYGYSSFEPAERTHCENCKHCFVDDSVGCLECENETMTDDEVDMYFTNENPCPYYLERYTAEEIAQEDAYYQSLVDQGDN